MSFPSQRERYISPSMSWRALCVSGVSVSVCFTHIFMSAGWQRTSRPAPSTVRFISIFLLRSVIMPFDFTVRWNYWFCLKSYRWLFFCRIISVWTLLLQVQCNIAVAMLSAKLRNCNQSLLSHDTLKNYSWNLLCIYHQ